MAVAVSSVRGKPKPRATTANFHRGASIWQEEEEEAPRGAATTSHTFSPPGLLAFPGRGKSSNPNVGEQSLNASLPSQLWNCNISVPPVIELCLTLQPLFQVFCMEWTQASMHL